MRVLAVSVMILSMVGCAGGDFPEVAGTLQETDTGSASESSVEVQTADSGSPETALPPIDSGTDTLVAESSPDTGSVPDTAVDSGTAPDTSPAPDTADTAPDTAPPPDTMVADTYVPPVDTAPVCMYASGTRVTTGDSSAVMVSGQFMCYEMRIRRSALPTGSEWFFETSNASHLKVGVNNTGTVVMMVGGNVAFSSVNITPGTWHTVTACKVPNTDGTYFHLQITVDGSVGDVSMSKIPLSVVIAPGTLSLGWSGDYDRARVYKRDGTVLASWPMDGNGDDTGPTGLDAAGSPTYTATACP